MGKLNSRLRSVEGGNIGHWCAGCGQMHVIYCGTPNPQNGSKWTFDYNLQCPTFHPSINIRAEFPEADGGPDVCHYFLKYGFIEYLGDCTHHLKGITIPLPDLPEGLQ